MKVEQLLYLKEAVKYKSISIAAEKNFISQPSLSGAINKLEKELGVELLRRTSKGVAPTEIGEMILEKSKIIFDTMREIESVASQHGQKGTVNVSSIPCICDRIIPKTVLKLKELEQDVMLSITTGESTQVAHNVSSGISSVGLLIYHEGLEDSMDLQYTPLFRDEYILYIGPFSPFWEAESITLEEMLKQPYIAYREEFVRNNGGLTGLLGKNNQPNVVFRTDDNESLKRMIAQDDYVAFFPKFMSRDDFYLQNGLIRAIPISDALVEIEVGLVESTKYKLNQIDRIFLDVLQNVIEKDTLLRK
ncbi:MAG: LysR family transcriptional regulator [Peptococcaceae bacterium]|nr:LysR family transcriptional regulator [Peptococcaceae bacterium]